MKAALLLALAGCSTIDHAPAPTDWPALKVVERRVSHAQMRDTCSAFVPWYLSPEACAVIRFNDRVCTITISADFPPSRSVLEHEREHCAGHDHPGETTLRDAARRAQ